MAQIEVTRLNSLGRIRYYKWGPMADGDAIDPLTPNESEPLAMGVQISGAFGGPVSLQASNDGVTWLDLNDVQGNPVSTTVDAIFEVSTSMGHLRPNPGVGVVAVDVIVCLRG